MRSAESHEVRCGRPMLDYRMAENRRTGSLATLQDDFHTSGNGTSLREIRTSLASGRKSRTRRGRLIRHAHHPAMVFTVPGLLPGR